MAENGSAKVKKSKNQIRRERAKLKKVSAAEQPDQAAQAVSEPSSVPESLPETNSEQISDARNGDLSSGRLFETDIERALDDPRFAEFKFVLDKFNTTADEPTADDNEQGRVFYSDDEDGQPGLVTDSEDESGGKTLTKRKLRKVNQLSLAQLKARSRRPEIVEWFDADAEDPELVAHLKSAPGAVQVPDHWLAKRDYLSGKRGLMRPFELPDFIKQTGIMDMRDALKEDERTLQQKMRERVQPKMGRLDIDYQKLHDAFFRFQTKPRLFGVGEIYYEGKELEIDVSRFRPGKLSSRLRSALSIPPGAPPPWLLNMQRYGPPPGFPGFRIPGVNAPIPAGAQWGFQPGGWGQAPLDASGAPLYGDVYGLTSQTKKSAKKGLPVERETWGAVVDEEEDEEEEADDDEEEEEEEEEEDDEGAGYVDEETALAADRERLEAEAAVPTAGLELRKSKRATEEPAEETQETQRPWSRQPKQLFQVLEEEQSSEKGFFGAQRGYKIPAASESTDTDVDPSGVRFQEDLTELLESSKRKAGK